LNDEKTPIFTHFFDPPRTIRAKHYKKLEILEPKAPCYSYGKKGSLYMEKFKVEHLTRLRTNRKPGGFVARVTTRRYKQSKLHRSHNPGPWMFPDTAG
jgi:hypothetical protein